MCVLDSYTRPGSRLLHTLYGIVATLEKLMLIRQFYHAFALWLIKKTHVYGETSKYQTPSVTQTLSADREQNNICAWLFSREKMYYLIVEDGVLKTV